MRRSRAIALDGALPLPPKRPPPRSLEQEVVAALVRWNSLRKAAIQFKTERARQQCWREATHVVIDHAVPMPSGMTWTEQPMQPIVTEHAIMPPADSRNIRLVFTSGTEPCWKTILGYANNDGKTIMLPRDQWCTECLTRQTAHEHYRQAVARRSAAMRRLQALAEKAGQGWSSMLVSWVELDNV